MSLKEYKEKRDFKKTNEPKGTLQKTQTNRFVVQLHKARAKHYDFRLEFGGVLVSFAVPKGLSNKPKEKRLAVKVEDHPVDYINFEGIIPKGNYGAGTVEIFDKGNYVALDDMKKGLKDGHIKVVLNGEKLKGAWSLIQIKDDNWIIIKIDDEYAEIETKKSSKSKKSTKIKNPFSSCSVELATLTDEIPQGKNWIFEIKYDGYRAVSFVENGKVKILSRNGLDFTKKFSSIANSLKKIDENAFVIDGEIVAFDEFGRSDFSLLQSSIKQKKNNFYYCVFDLIALNGEDLRNLPLQKRKEKLERLLFKSEKTLMYSEHVEDGFASFKFAKENNLEGVVAKKKDSKYVGKRTNDWLKIKCVHRQEFVILGYTTSDKNEILSALILGVYKGKDLKYVGKVGTGFNEKDKTELVQKFKKIIRKTSPLKSKINEKNVIWLSPKLVAEIKFAELTKDKLLRQPSFVGLREDKDPKDVKLEI